MKESNTKNINIELQGPIAYLVDIWDNTIEPNTFIVDKDLLDSKLEEIKKSLPKIKDIQIFGEITPIYLTNNNLISNIVANNFEWFGKKPKKGYLYTSNKEKRDIIIENDISKEARSVLELTKTPIYSKFAIRLFDNKNKNELKVYQVNENDYIIIDTDQNVYKVDKNLINEISKIDTCKIVDIDLKDT
jgi:hypothetical protein